LSHVPPIPATLESREERAIMSTFPTVIPIYLRLHVAEFQFLYNNRTNSIIFGATIPAYVK
jgi:hypothetical protein